MRVWSIPLFVLLALCASAEPAKEIAFGVVFGSSMPRAVVRGQDSRLPMARWPSEDGWAVSVQGNGACGIVMLHATISQVRLTFAQALKVLRRKYGRPSEKRIATSAGKARRVEWIFKQRDDRLHRLRLFEAAGVYSTFVVLEYASSDYLGCKQTTAQRFD